MPFIPPRLLSAAVTVLSQPADLATSAPAVTHPGRPHLKTVRHYLDLLVEHIDLATAKLTRCRTMGPTIDIHASRRRLDAIAVGTEELRPLDATLRRKGWKRFGCICKG